MKILTKRCRTCGALGLGPHPVKLFPFEGHLYCRDDFKDALTWDESRPSVVYGISSRKDFDSEAAKYRRHILRQKVWPPANHVKWEPYIRDLCGLAEWGLLHQDKKIFTRYAALAVLAWGMKEAQT